ncbi:class I SAM-dependent methyltransferase, partial [candidate division KSB1 bacterium]
KILIGPFKYGQKDDYNAAKYWEDRYKKYGSSLLGPGDESVSEEENKDSYIKAGLAFKELCKNENIDFENMNILEIGVGNGFYTGIFKELGTKHLTGLDIADTLFDSFREKFPDYKFIKKDLTKDEIGDKFDFITMVDVAQHIVKKEKLQAALENIKNSLSENGIFFIAPLVEKSKRELYYVHVWSKDDIIENFEGFDIKSDIVFRNNQGLIIRKKGKQ